MAARTAVPPVVGLAALYAVDLLRPVEFVVLVALVALAVVCFRLQQRERSFQLIYAAAGAVAVVAVVGFLFAFIAGEIAPPSAP